MPRLGTEGDLARPLSGLGHDRTDQWRVGHVRPKPQEHVQQNGQHQDPQLPVTAV